MLPLGLLNAAQGHPMLVELKNGETLNGHLISCDTWMNLTLKEVVQTSPEGDKFFRLPEVYVRGNNYRTRLSSSSKTNSKISHQAVAEVAVFREAIMEEEETEEEVGQEELVEEEEVEVESLDCEHLVNLPKIVIKTCTSMATKGLES
ncbi:MAG: RNA processing protein [Alectoria fallacina]|uniref:LSM complex subunit LSM4 n=1 Tax=Alectoria fallacina TaxID=1903189 RepID=A0A8H3IQC7_9LECA|nr:MAG: RNA processing protein [Alectoria fallacina]